MDSIGLAVLDPSKRRPGPAKREGRRQYPVILDESVAEWAKNTPDGLSGLVRRLLQDEYERTQRPSVETPAE